MNVMASLLTLGRKHFVVLAMATGIGISGTMVWTASNAAFSGHTTNPGNNWTTGTVSLTDDDTGSDADSGTALFTATGLVPGQAAVSKCIRVNYTGNASAKVRMYASALTDTDSLGQYINLQIEEGAGTAAFGGTPACGNADATFTADRTIYGAALSGDVAEFGAKGTYTDGVPATSEWTPNSAATKVYKITYQLDPNTPGTHQGKTCTIAFRWEAVGV